MMSSALHPIALLPLDVVKLIAYDEASWIILMQIRPDFHQYSWTAQGRRDFVSTCTVQTTCPLGTEYRLLGRLHREADQPAIISANGDQLWYYAGQLHRGSTPPTRDAMGPPAIIYASGDKYWVWRGRTYNILQV